MRPAIFAENELNVRQRHIRSFVRREGRLTFAQKRALESLWPRYGIDYAGCAIDFNVQFGREAERILEIGFGNGEALLASALRHPEKDFIGIEVHRPGIGHLLSALDQQHLTNVRLFCHDAIEVLDQCIDDENLDAVHLFFPDPWPKKRHHKRRIVQTVFMDKIHRVLQAEGIFYAATDWADYARHIQVVLADYKQFVELVPSEIPRHRVIQRPITKFELRGQKLNHDIHDLIYKKTNL